MRQDRNMTMFFASFDGTEWEALGRDNDDLTKDLNPDVETSKNVLGEASVKVSGYEPQVSLDPYYVDKESPLYEKLKAAAEEELYDDESIKGFFIEANYDSKDKEAGTMTCAKAKKREAYIIPQSTGGDTSGSAIPFNVYPFGPMTDVKVVYTMKDRSVEVTAAGGA